MKNQDRRHIVALLSLLAALQGSGCSWIFVTPPPEAPGPSRVDDSCTKSKAAPVLDSLGAGFQVARTMLAATAPQSVYDDPDAPISREADLSFGIALTTMFVASAYYGFSNTAQCRERDEPGPEWASDEQPEEDSVPRLHRVGEGYKEPRPTRAATPADVAATPAPTDAAPEPAPHADVTPEPAAPASPAPTPTVPIAVTPEPAAPASETPTPQAPSK